MVVWSESMGKWTGRSKVEGLNGRADAISASGLLVAKELKATSVARSFASLGTLTDSLTDSLTHSLDLSL